MGIARHARLIACAMLLAAGISGGARAQASAPIIDAPSAHGIIQAGGILLDIRTPADREGTGTPEGAVAIPLQDDERRFRGDFAADVLKAAGDDPSRPIAIIDENGRRSEYAARLLASQGFTQAFAVGEGLLGSNLGPGWIARGLPMQR